MTILTIAVSTIMWVLLGYLILYICYKINTENPRPLILYGFWEVLVFVLLLLVWPGFIVYLYGKEWKTKLNVFFNQKQFTFYDAEKHKPNK